MSSAREIKLILDDITTLLRSMGIKYKSSRKNLIIEGSSVSDEHDSSRMHVAGSTLLKPNLLLAESYRKYPGFRDLPESCLGLAPSPSSDEVAVTGHGQQQLVTVQVAVDKLKGPPCHIQGSSRMPLLTGTGLLVEEAEGVPTTIQARWACCPTNTATPAINPRQVFTCIYLLFT